MASLSPSPAQSRRRDAVATFLAAACPLPRVREAEPLGFDPALWDDFVAVAEVEALAGDLVGAALVAEEVGRVLAPIPFVEHVSGIRAVRRAGAVPAPGIHTVAVNVAAANGRLVPAGAIAHHVVALAEGELRCVTGTPPGAGPRNLAALPLADRNLGGGTRLADGDTAAALLAATRADWQVLTAAALVGLAAAALERTVDYVQHRHQFGVPIGSFQAVQHELADRVTAVEGARLLVWLAASGEDPADASAAFLFATQTARAATSSAMQYHGGYGFRLDRDPQLFHRRAKGWPLVAGDPAREWERLGALRYAPQRSAKGRRAPHPPTEGIDFRIPAHAEDFRAEVREFLAEAVTPEMIERVHRTGTVHDWDFHRGLAARGWIGLSWPVEDGGQGRDPWEARVFAEECALADAPTDGLSIVTMIGNTIRVVGTPEQKQRILPGLLRGDDLLCMGYTEPEAGSDVAATRTTATRDGDDWIVNGEKVFTSMAHEARYVFLLTRTNPEAPKHRGLTMFLVPMDTPGITVEPIWTLGAPGRTNRTVYDNVRVPDRWRIGEVDGGWAVMNVALTFERGGSFAPIRALRLAEEWARSTGWIDDPDVRVRLARIHVRNQVSSLLSLKSTWLHATGALPGVEGSMAKLFAASAFQASTADLLDLVGAEGLLHETEPGAPVDGFLEHQWRKSPVVTIYGGTNEVLRTIVAERHLGLPRTR